jgi:threonine dehydrogenase-like Zn-dependent dehydrogenase
VKGLVLAGPREVEFRTDLPDPAIRDPGDAIVRVELAGICGSDLHPYEGREATAWGVIPGHEAVGEVVAAGPSVERFHAGDRVFLPFTTSCGACAPCRRGLSSRCTRGRLFGWAPPDAPREGLPGTQAEYVRVPLADTTLLELPEGRIAAEGVLLGDNFTTGYWAALRALELISSGAGPVSAVVIGCGAVGLSAIVSARYLGAAPLLAVDPVESRRAAALRLGAEAAAPPAEASVKLEDLVGSGVPAADVVIEAVGSGEARALALRLSGPGATISSVGVATSEFGVRPAELYDRNVTWRSGRCPVYSLMPRLLGDLAEGLDIPISELLPAPPLGLEEGPRAYARFAARTAGVGKPLLAP